jgi:hypothetical protein
LQTVAKLREFCSSIATRLCSAFRFCEPLGQILLGTHDRRVITFQIRDQFVAGCPFVLNRCIEVGMFPRPFVTLLHSPA